MAHPFGYYAPVRGQIFGRTKSELKIPTNVRRGLDKSREIASSGRSENAHYTLATMRRYVYVVYALCNVYSLYMCER